MKVARSESREENDLLTSLVKGAEGAAGEFEREAKKWWLLWAREALLKIGANEGSREVVVISVRIGVLAWAESPDLSAVLRNGGRGSEMEAPIYGMVVIR